MARPASPAKKHVVLLKSVSICSTYQASLVEASASQSRLGQIKAQTLNCHLILQCYANLIHAAYMFDDMLIPVQCEQRVFTGLDGVKPEEQMRGDQGVPVWLSEL
jgi:hypothetical protein